MRGGPMRGGPMRGGLIAIEPDGVLGWATNPAEPESPVQVRLMIGGQVVADAVADRFEDARVRNLVGPGIGGFLARLAAPPTATYPCQISLHDPTGAPLGAPLPVRQPADLAHLARQASADSVEGHVDGLFDGVLMGWARDTSQPDRVLELELLDAEAPIGHARADRLREDLRQAGLHHGLYGYRFELPVGMLDGRAHSLSVRVAGTGVKLRGGPISFGPLATTALLTQFGALQAEVAKLREQVDALIAPDGSLQRRIMRVLAERLAAQSEIGREQLDRDIDALRIMVFQANARTQAASTAPEQYGVPVAKRRRG